VASDLSRRFKAAGGAAKAADLLTEWTMRVERP